MFRFIPDNTAISFMRYRTVGLLVAAVLGVLSVSLFFFPGLNYGIDFRGGLLIEVQTPDEIDIASLRGPLNALDVGTVFLQQFGSARDFLIRLQPEDEQGALVQIRTALEDLEVEIRRVEAVGAVVSDELLRSGLWAIGLGLLAMLLYIWFRFEWQFGLGALLTLLFDVIAMVGIYSASSIQFNLTSVAAILTIIGYSINDKVVVYDRMRENLRLHKKMPLRDLIDLSINQTLNRTVGTSLTTLLAATPLAILGGAALASFAIPLIFGVILGTLSSIFIAAPILFFLGEGRLKRL